MFLNATMLAGICGAALPLIVHLLSRARVRTVDWGAMMFLADERGAQDQAARLKQWTLLLLRMAIVALLAVAMARPVAAGRWAGPPGPLTAVIVLDCSASMAQPTASGRTRMDAAREAVLRILSGMRKGDRATLILAGGDQPRRAAEPPSADLQAVAARVAEAKPTSSSADIAAALNDAADIFNRYGGANAHLYLVCDAQAASWAGAGAAFRTNWPARTTRSGRGLPFDVTVVGESGSNDNVAIESIVLTTPPAIAGIAAEVELMIRHFGGGSAGAGSRVSVPLTVRSSKEELFKGTIDVTPGAAGSATFPVRFDAPGQQMLTAEITSGTLSSDDRMQFVLDVVPPIRVLIVSGDERTGSGGAFRSESDFLRTALAPFASLKRLAVDPASVTVLPIEKWSDAALANADVLVFANVAELTPQQVRAIEAFVYAGGGLLVAPGGTTRADSYNRTLYRDGAGLLPAALAAPTSEQPTSLLGIELSHPIFRFLRGRPDPIPSAIVTRVLPATPRQGAATLGSYVTGQPFLIDGAYGRGRVLLMTSTADADWNTLPLTSFYLPFVQSAVRYLASAGMPQRNLPPGDDIRARFVEAPEGVRATITVPGGRQVVQQATGAEGNYEVTHADTRVPGVYTLRTRVGGAERVERYVVRPPIAESDLKPLAATDWAVLQKSLGFHRTRPGARETTMTSGDTSGGRELWLAALLGVLLLTTLELTLTRFWSEGRQ